MAAGIRSNAGNRPIADARELKQLHKERRSAFRRLRREQVTPEPAIDALPTGLAPTVPGPVLPAQF
jgi:hypothetical protein